MAIEPFDARLMLVEQFVGRQIGGVLITCVGDAWQRLAVFMNEAAQAFFKQRACEHVSTTLQAILLNGLIDPAVDLLFQAVGKAVENFRNCYCLKPRDADVDKMSVETA